MGGILSSLQTPSPVIKAPFDKMELDRRFDALIYEREKWTPKWKEIRSFINPWLGEFKNENKSQTRYSRQDDNVFDGVGFDASNTLAAGVMFGLTPRSRPWFKLGFADPELSEWEEAKGWLDDVGEIMYAGLNRSNAYKSFHTSYLENGVFGTSALGLWEDRDTMFRTKTFQTGSYALGTDSFGKVNTFCRDLRMNPMQLSEKFGYDILPRQIRELVDRKDYKSEIDVRHVIEPNTETFDGAWRSQDLPYREYYWLASGNHKTALRVSGYHEFPIMAPRWLCPGDSPYGYGPGWFALAETKGLQLMTEDYYSLVEMLLKPPLVATAASHRAGINFFPGGVTIVEDTSQNGGSVRPLMQVNPDLNAFLAQRQDSRQIIKRRFYADMFMMLDSLDKGQMTAREVIERSQEKMTMLGPSIENYEDEFLKPFINRAFSIIDRWGLLPPPPPEIEGQELKIEFLSPLSQAQKMAGLTGLEQGMAFVMNLAPMFPEVLAKVKPIEVVEQYWDSLGNKAGSLRNDNEMKEIQEQQAQQQQAAQQGVAMEQASNVAKNLASADMGSENALTALLGSSPNGTGQMR